MTQTDHYLSSFSGHDLISLWSASILCFQISSTFHLVLGGSGLDSRQWLWLASVLVLASRVVPPPWLLLLLGYLSWSLCLGRRTGLVPQFSVAAARSSLRGHVPPATVSGSLVPDIAAFSRPCLHLDAPALTVPIQPTSIRQNHKSSDTKLVSCNSKWTPNQLRATIVLSLKTYNEWYVLP